MERIDADVVVIGSGIGGLCAAALLAHAAAQTVLPPLHPRLKLSPEGKPAGVLLPGQRPVR